MRSEADMIAEHEAIRVAQYRLDAARRRWMARDTAETRLALRAAENAHEALIPTPRSDNARQA